MSQQPVLSPRRTKESPLKTENGKNVTLQIRLSEGRSGESILTSSMNDSVQGTKFWMPYWGDVPSHEDANFFDIRMKNRTN